MYKIKIGNSKKEKLRDLSIARICRLIKYKNMQKYADMRLFWFDYFYWPKYKKHG